MVESWLQEFIDNGFDYCDVEPTTEAPHTRPDVSIPTRPGETTTEGTHTRPDVSIPTRPGETTTEGEESTDPIHLCDDPLWRNHGNPDPDQYNHLCGDMNLESCQDMDNWLEVQTHCPNQCSVVLGDVGLDQAAIDGAQGNCDIEVPPAQADCCDDPDYTYQDSPCEDQIGNCDVEEVIMHCPMTCQQSELPWNEISESGATTGARPTQTSTLRISVMTLTSCFGVFIAVRTSGPAIFVRITRMLPSIARRLVLSMLTRIPRSRLGWKSSSIMDLTTVMLNRPLRLHILAPTLTFLLVPARRPLRALIPALTLIFLLGLGRRPLRALIPALTLIFLLGLERRRLRVVIVNASVMGASAAVMPRSRLKRLRK